MQTIKKFFLTKAFMITFIITLVFLVLNLR